MNKSFFKENLPLIALMILTAAGITVTAVIFGQQFWRILPLYVSLTVALLQSRMLRAASLVGGLNSILYAAVYFSYSLYASAAYALFISCPMQIVTFIRWSKRPWGQTTVFKKLSAKSRVLIALGACIAAAVIALISGNSGGEFALLDSVLTVMGILSATLMMLSFCEYPVITTAGNVVSLTLYILMLKVHPEQTTYIVFTVYSLICNAAASIRIRRVCRQQSAEKTRQ